MICLIKNNKLVNETTWSKKITFMNEKKKEHMINIDLNSYNLFFN